MAKDLPHRKKSKIIGSLLIALIVLLVLCVLFLPAFFSTASGKKTLLKMISHRTGLQIEMNELSLSWFGTQHAQSIHAQKQGQLELTIERIQTDAPLWKIVFFHRFGNLHIVAPKLQISKPFLPISKAIQRVVTRSQKPYPNPFQAAGFAAFIDFPTRGQFIVQEGK